MGILCVFCVYDTIGNRCFEKTSFPKSSFLSKTMKYRNIFLASTSYQTAEHARIQRCVCGGGGGGPGVGPTPGQSLVLWVSMGNKRLDPPPTWENLDPWKMLDPSGTLENYNFL